MKDDLYKYLTEASEITYLDKETEHKLIIDGQNGDLAARDRVILTCLKYVYKMAKQMTAYYAVTDELFEDLIFEGNLGLFVAFDRFDVSRDVKFITFAHWYIKLYIADALDKYGFIVKFPNGVRADVLRLRYYLAECKLDKQCPSDDDCIKYFGWKEQRFFLAKCALPFVTLLSLDHENKSDDKQKPKDLYNLIATDKTEPLPLPAAVDDHDNAVKAVKALLDKIPPHYRLVIKRRFGIGCRPRKLDEIGREMKLSKERVRQIQLHALRMLSKYTHGSSLPLYSPRQMKRPQNRRTTLATTK